MQLSSPLAWFTPWPPDRHPAARRSRDIARGLAARGIAVDLVVADPAVRATDSFVADTSGVRIVPAAEYQAFRAGYDLTVYHLANEAAAEFMWPSVEEQPGLVVLHDTSVYAMRRAGAPARAAAFRAEFARCHPDADPDAAELAVTGYAGAYEACWPMMRAVIASARVVAVPSAAAGRAVRSWWPDATIVTLTAGIDGGTPPGAEARTARRSALEVENEAVVFGVVGSGDDAGARRLPQILRAFASTLGRVPRARLVIAGIDVDLAAQPPEVRAALSRVNAADEEERRQVIDAMDVLVDLHWPPLAGPSDHWLAGMAAGRPVVFLDTTATADVPVLDPRSWRPPPDGRDPVGVGIDILDEDHSLRVACYRLAVDRALRDRLGRAARAHWERTHTLRHMIDSVVRAIDRAIGEPSARPGPGQPDDPRRQDWTC